MVKNEPRALAAKLMEKIYERSNRLIQMYKVQLTHFELFQGKPSSPPLDPPYLFGLSTLCFAAGVKGRIICTECRGGRSLFRERSEE